VIERGAAEVRASAPLALLIGGLMVASGPAWAQGVPQPAPTRAPVDKLVEIGPAITACWHPPPDSAGSELVVRFSLNRWGVLIGKPEITFSKLNGDEPARRRFVATVLAALASCTPLPVTEGLGGTIAGRPIAIRFISSRRAEAI
jgi:hypothetical protein